MSSFTYDLTLRVPGGETWLLNWCSAPPACISSVYNSISLKVTNVLEFGIGLVLPKNRSWHKPGTLLKQRCLWGEKHQQAFRCLFWGHGWRGTLSLCRGPVRIYSACNKQDYLTKPFPNSKMGSQAPLPPGKHTQGCNSTLVSNRSRHRLFPREVSQTWPPPRTPSSSLPCAGPRAVRSLDAERP